MEISRRIGIIFGRYSGIFPRSREKVNNGSLILTWSMQGQARRPEDQLVSILLSSYPDQWLPSLPHLGMPLLIPILLTKLLLVSWLSCIQVTFIFQLLTPWALPFLWRIISYQARKKKIGRCPFWILSGTEAHNYINYYGSLTLMNFGNFTYFQK